MTFPDEILIWIRESPTHALLVKNEDARERGAVGVQLMVLDELGKPVKGAGYLIRHTTPNHRILHELARLPKKIPA